MRRLHPMLGWLAGLALCAAAAFGAQVYNFFPPPGLLYSTGGGTTTISSPAGVAAPGVNLSFISGAGNGTNQPSGTLLFQAGQATGTAQTSLIFDGSLNGPTFGGGSLTPNMAFKADANSALNFFGASASGACTLVNTCAAVATVQNPDLRSGAEMVFGVENDSADGFITCTLTTNYAGPFPDPFCNLARKGHFFGFNAINDIFFGYGAAAQPNVFVINLNNVSDTVTGRLSWLSTVPMRFQNDTINTALTAYLAGSLTATSNTTPACASGMTLNLPAPAGQKYSVIIDAFFNGTTTGTQGIKVGFGGTATFSPVSQISWRGVNGAFAGDTGAAAAETVYSVATISVAPAVDYLHTVLNGTTTIGNSTLCLTFSQNTSSANATNLLAGSTVTATHYGP